MLILLGQSKKGTDLIEVDIKAVAVAALEIWLAEQHSTASGRSSDSAVPFIRRLIADNRELFDALAQR